VTDLDGPDGQPPDVVLTAEDQADLVAFMRLLK
jgi:hypothetical protein